MTNLVPPAEIEGIVGVPRHATEHWARAVSAEQQVYVLHSAQCRDSGIDLRCCAFSIALDRGIDLGDWDGVEDTAVPVMIGDDGLLFPDWTRMEVPDA